MPKVEIRKSTPVKRSPRLRQVEGMFDLRPEKTQNFALDAELPLDAKPWQIGLIVGPSGCGKTTLARELFGASLSRHDRVDWPADASIIDHFPRGLSIRDITGLLSSVGFSSPPAWCRPFQTLSNGEQFRVGVAFALAQALAPADSKPDATVSKNETAEPIVIDEFTSVVDRTVAQVGSSAIAKAVRSRPGLRFIAVSCHFDIVEWLQPDWTFEPASGLFTWRSLRRRPEIRLEILRASPDLWDTFRRHHYLSSDLGASARCFVGLVEGRPATWTAVTSFPHAIRPGWREHRTVCLPDFQGVGLGNAMSEFVAALYRTTGKPYRSVTSHPAMIRHRARSPLWKMTREPGFVHNINNPNIGGFGGQTVEQRHAHFMKTNSCGRITATFEYIGPARLDCAWLLGDDVPLVGGRLAGKLRAILGRRACTMAELARETGYSSTRISGLLIEIGATRIGRGSASSPFRYYWKPAGDVISSS